MSLWRTVFSSQYTESCTLFRHYWAVTHTHTHTHTTIIITGSSTQLLWRCSYSSKVFLWSSKTANQPPKIWTEGHNDPLNFRFIGNTDKALTPTLPLPALTCSSQTTCITESHHIHYWLTVLKQLASIPSYSTKYWLRPYHSQFWLVVLKQPASLNHITFTADSLFSNSSYQFNHIVQSTGSNPTTVSHWLVVPKQPASLNHIMFTAHSQFSNSLHQLHHMLLSTNSNATMAVTDL